MGFDQCISVPNKGIEYITQVTTSKGVYICGVQRSSLIVYESIVRGKLHFFHQEMVLVFFNFYLYNTNNAQSFLKLLIFVLDIFLFLLNLVIVILLVIYEST